MSLNILLIIKKYEIKIHFIAILQFFFNKRKKLYIRYIGAIIIFKISINKIHGIK